MPSSNASSPSPSSAADLAARLAAIWPTLRDDDRRNVADTLTAAGLGAAMNVAASNANPGDGVAPSPELVKLCELRGAATISASSAGAAVETLVTFARNVENIAWETWREVAPQASLRRGGSVGGFVGRVLVADSAEGRSEAVAKLKKLELLIGAIINGVPVATRVSVAQLRNMMPRAIRDVVTAEGVAGGSSKYDVACWRKYLQIASDLDEGSVDNEVRRAIAVHVVRLVPD